MKHIKSTKRTPEEIEEFFKNESKLREQDYREAEMVMHIYMGFIITIAAVGCLVVVGIALLVNHFK